MGSRDGAGVPYHLRGPHVCRCVHTPMYVDEDSQWDMLSHTTHPVDVQTCAHVHIHMTWYMLTCTYLLSLLLLHSYHYTSIEVYQWCYAQCIMSSTVCNVLLHYHIYYISSVCMYCVGVLLHSVCYLLHGVCVLVQCVCYLCTVPTTMCWCACVLIVLHHC